MTSPGAANLTGFGAAGDLLHRSRMKVIHTDARGSLAMSQDGPVLAFRVEGQLTVDVAKAIAAESARVIATHGRYAAMHDWSAMKKYDAGARELLTEFASKHRKQVVATHILVSSGFVALGVNAAALALKPLGVVLTCTTDADTFARRGDELHQRSAA